MKVVSFLGGIPPRNNNPAKPAMLHAYVQGVNAAGDVGIDTKEQHTKSVMLQYFKDLCTKAVLIVRTWLLEKMY